MPGVAGADVEVGGVGDGADPGVVVAGETHYARPFVGGGEFDFFGGSGLLLVAGFGTELRLVAQEVAVGAVYARG